jgi:exopolysaccharide production protein ExoQ
VTASAQAWEASPFQQRERASFKDLTVMAIGVMVVLVFSEAWIVPIFGDKTGAEQGGLIRAIYFPGYIGGIILLAMSGLDVVRALVRQPFLIFLMLLAVASYFWSIDPGETVRRVVALLLSMLAGIALATKFRWGRLAEVFAIAFALMTVGSLVASAAIPHIGREAAGSEFPGAWRGLWAEKNALGGNMALFFPAFVTAAIFNPRRRYLWAFMALLCVAMLLASTSKTALIAMILGMGALVMVALIRSGAAMAVVTSWLAVLVVGVIASVLIFDRTAVFAALGKDATLTGRTVIWKAVMIQIEKKPWLGHGYGTVWTDESRWGPLAWIVKDAHFRPYHSHNSWLEQWLWLGMTGLIGWSLFWMQTLTTGIIAVFRDKGAYLAFPILLVYSMISLTESVTMTYNDLHWVLFVAIAVKLALPDNPGKEEPFQRFVSS